VVVLPGWLKLNFIAFCESEGIAQAAFDLVPTDGSPFMLRHYLAYLERRRRPPRESRFAHLADWLRRVSAENRRRFERRFVAARNAISWLATFIYATVFAAALLPLGAFVWLAVSGGRVSRKLWNKLCAAFRAAGGKVLNLLHEPGEESLDVRLYRLMEEIETERMVEKINTLRHVAAWLSPTAFWPAFNRISAPGLLCVPDVMLAEFPIGFAREPELLRSFEQVERTILGARSFVTYSAKVKWTTLVDRYAIRPEDIAVVPHSCWDLSPLIQVNGFPDENKATNIYCQSLLQQALGRTGLTGYVQMLRSGSLKFLFYASQFRPNKNVQLLIEAYEHLLRKRYTHHKLILTGDPNRDPQVQNLVRARGLAQDVIFLHGLTTPELAACYRLADLAVNPSLSEGGCPFTFTEALSVNTPVVMARIPLTEEVLADTALQEMTLFDPYDYEDASRCIQWALDNREALLRAQQPAYIRLCERSWRDVVDDYVTILNRLSISSSSAGELGK
jgi:hypothetical protein